MVSAVDGDGKVHEASGRGAVFRCDSDGSNFEVYAHGLRNPQDLAFDNHGNSFYLRQHGRHRGQSPRSFVLDNTDSGWDMAHQSPHHYANALDWGDFYLPKSVWVGQKMFETYRKDQPQWVYPPVAHVGNGPSGVTWLSGMSVPKDLRDTFALTDYRGAPKNSVTHAIKLSAVGSTFKVSEVKSIVQGLAASDAEHGYDGNLYFADYGGGWSVNKNGSIQVLRPADPQMREVGAGNGPDVSKGLRSPILPELALLLEHSDQRVRQASQFAMVGKGLRLSEFFPNSQRVRRNSNTHHCMPFGDWVNCIVRGWKVPPIPLSMPCHPKNPRFGPMRPRCRGLSGCRRPKRSSEVIEGPFIPGGFSFGNRPWQGCS